MISMSERDRRRRAPRESDRQPSADRTGGAGSAGAGAVGDETTGVRLQKVLAGAGVASRRKAEELIRAGRVRVDGIVVRQMGLRIDPDRAVVHVDGNRIAVRSDLVYVALNKMPGVLSSMSDPEGRPHIGEMLADWGVSTRLFHVGRLDRDSEGLLLLTNDGELAQRLTHPSYGVPKTYMAEVPGPIPRDLGRRLRAGVDLDDGPVRVDDFDIADVLGGRAVVKVVVHEGRKHLVRRMLASVGHPVSRLVRTQIGEVKLGHQRPGTLRKLNPVEIAQLYRAVDL